jgi:asparagine synthase (glutamine-hydrolysing)
MSDLLRHRGPDGDGIYIDGAAGLAHRRLAIIDLSDEGRQPMANEDGTLWLVFNGEIYNYRELMEELISCGHTFRSSADTEVILHAYEEWGRDCLARFNGMWAFALWDSRKKELFCAGTAWG